MTNDFQLKLLLLHKRCNLGASEKRPRHYFGDFLLFESIKCIRVSYDNNRGLLRWTYPINSKPFSRWYLCLACCYESVLPRFRLYKMLVVCLWWSKLVFFFKVTMQ